LSPASRAARRSANSARSNCCVQQGVTQQDFSVTSAVLAVGVFSLLTVGLSWINTRSRGLRPLTTGVPLVIVEDGEPVLATLRVERISMDDLMSAAREQGVERFDNIRVAVLETNGRISFFTRDHQSEGAPETPTAG